MIAAPPARELADRATFYRDALSRLNRSGIPFLIGGAFAFRPYTAIERYTKDLDIFVAPKEAPRILALLAKAGYRTEMTFSHWLGKILDSENRLIDVIFGSGNGLCVVDQDWFNYAVPSELAGVQVQLCAPEEMIWSKAFILERDRYDGADIAHLIRALGPSLDWDRLFRRFAENWPVLFSHLILFSYIYPCHRSLIPAAVWDRVRREFEIELSYVDDDPRKLCRGTLLSVLQYRRDVEDWGYDDARLSPHGRMTPEQVERWTQAFKP